MAKRATCTRDAAADGGPGVERHSNLKRPMTQRRAEGEGLVRAARLSQCGQTVVACSHSGSRQLGGGGWGGAPASWAAERERTTDQWACMGA
jgi:hypothetical protein